MTAPLVITGGIGFLGWHVRVLARALGLPAPLLVDREDFAEPARLAEVIEGADRVVHLAGLNRGEPSQVATGNVELAGALVRAIQRCATPPKVVAFANSVQAGNGTPYGDSKAAAADLLAEATQWSGAVLEDVRLPNLFGEHGRPHYNSVVATFCRLLASGEAPAIEVDRALDLMHVTDAAALMLGVESPLGSSIEPARRTVRQLADQIGEFAGVYRTGDIPVLASAFDVRLFNTYRSHCFPAHYPIRLARHADARGELVEAVKAHGGGGQTFFSTTRPGITRGQHFHLAKVERFLVVSGEAEIALRRVLHDDVIRFRVSGREPVVVDMPTMWAHSITNVGDDDLLTLFWANEVFDPVCPDTFAEAV
jgi:UDP-2-acetamido-2,6-beta-L-arabino-hexul-4-ose reductase